MKVLAIGIHIDDCEAMGGTLNLLAREGAEVTILNIMPYTDCSGRNKDADEQSMKAAAVLGAKKIILDYEGTKQTKKP